MIQISFDILTGQARVNPPTTLKVGADVPVRVLFSAAVAEDTAVSLALGTDAAPPAVLAFTDDFTRVNPTTWTATLDANDTRLRDFMATKGATQVNAEITAIIDGVKRVSNNAPVTVQPAIVDGPETSEGGPTYYTEAEVDAGFVPKTVAGKYRFKPDGSLQLWNATQSKWHTLTLSGAAGAEVLAIGAGES